MWDGYHINKHVFTYLIIPKTYMKSKDDYIFFVLVHEKTRYIALYQRIVDLELITERKRRKCQEFKIKETLFDI